MCYDTKLLVPRVCVHYFGNCICHILCLVSNDIRREGTWLVIEIETIHVRTVEDFVLLFIQVSCIVVYRVRDRRQLNISTHISRDKEVNSGLLYISSIFEFCNKTFLLHSCTFSDCVNGMPKKFTRSVDVVAVHTFIEKDRFEERNSSMESLINNQETCEKKSRCYSILELHFFNK